MEKQTKTTSQLCDDCALAEWDMKFPNLDVWKKPTLLHCPHQKFAIIRGTHACEHFKLKNAEKEANQ